MELNEIITMFLDWQDSKPLDHFVNMDNETIGEIFERVYEAHEKHTEIVRNGDTSIKESVLPISGVIESCELCTHSVACHGFRRLLANYSKRVCKVYEHVL